MAWNSKSTTFGYLELLFAVVQVSCNLTSIGSYHTNYDMYNLLALHRA